MATRNPKPAAETPAEETVQITNPWAVRREVYIPKERGGSSKFVAVNGRTYNIPTGRTVSVPLPVAEVIEHSQEAMDHAEAVRAAQREQ